MNCADAEILICDYATLQPAERSALEQHLAGCSACAELVRDGEAALSFMALASDVEPPPELITRILFDAPWTREKQKQRKGWLTGLLSPVLQPRFAMGMAMTILSLSMLARFVVPVRQLRPADLSPTAVWTGIENRAVRIWARSVKFYDNLKFVYQIQTTLQDWQQQDQDRRKAEPKADDRKLPIRSDPNRSSAVPGGAPTSNPPVSQ